MSTTDTQIAEALVLLKSALTLLDDAQQHAAAAGTDQVIQILQASKKTDSGV
jgi:hypothetical protein